MSIGRTRTWSLLPTRRRRLRLLAMLLLAASLGANASADLDDPRVIRGDVVFERNGDLYIIRASDNAIINYRGLSIEEYETLRFIQPHRNARVLNRVTGEQFTRIDGKLLSNGIVYIVNPAGIYFGNGAVVDVGGLYAAAGTISNNSFLAGSDRFKNLQGDVVNEGAIHADAAHLIGGRVVNHGTISADRGVITMVAGEDVLLRQQGDRLHVKVDGSWITDRSRPHAGGTDPNPDALAGVHNTGVVSATRGQLVVGAGDLYALAINNEGLFAAERGHVTVAATDGLVENHGTITASTAGGRAGTVVVQGPHVVNAGEISADTDRGRAGAVEVTSQSHTYLLDGSVVSAAGGTRNARGGNVLIHSWGGLTVFADGAVVDVSGGRRQGRGGYAEVSGDALLFAGTVRLQGGGLSADGTLLIDPFNITIAEQGQTEFDGTITFDEGPDELVLAASALEAILGDIILQARNDLTVDHPVFLVNGNDVTFEAGRNIIFNAPIFGARDLTSIADHGIFVRTDLAVTRALTFIGDTTFDGAGAQRMDAAAIKFRDNAFKITPGALTLAGFSGVFVSGDVVAAGGDLRFGGPAFFDGEGDQDIVADGTLVFDGDLTKTIDGRLMLSGTDGIRMGGNAAAPGALVFSDDTTFDGVGRQIVEAVGLKFLGDLAKSTGGDLDLIGTAGIFIAGDAETTAGDLAFLGDTIFDGTGDQTARARGGELSFAGGVEKITPGTGTAALTLRGTDGIRVEGDVAGTGDLIFGDVALKADDLFVTGDIEGLGAVTFAGHARLRGDVFGDCIVFMNRATLTGRRNQTIAATGDAGLLFCNLLAKTEAGSLTLAAPRIEFRTSLVTALDDILLNPAGRALDDLPTDATIVRPNGDLTIRSERGDVRMGFGEKMSVGGDLRIEAQGPGATAQLGDLSALGGITVIADNIDLLARPAAASDVGLDFVAGTGIDFSVVPTVISGVGRPGPRFGTISGGGISDTLFGFVQVATDVTPGFSALAAGASVDLVANGPTADNVSGVADVGGDDAEVILGDGVTGVTAASVAVLERLGVATRRAASVETLIDDTATPEAVSVERLDPASMRALWVAYTGLFGSVDLEDTQRRTIRETLASAWSARPDADALRQQADATTRRYLEELSSIRTLLTRTGLNASEVERAEETLLMGVCPDAMPLDAFRAATGS
ncbi:MAG: filamentous hemagglutinin N-terminal domain-containing protein [Phycisphaerales bacterium]|nr:filamentous hemagglutinin N-terminal domain-containing protein [Phycisphaerae bacterium]NNF45064.1 filamentous hemagglutinin N-terminal domain-containing protein [Phycisphaerales bacterium]NNM25893.1 filamentous hemagglutinin N-terminal domain-containing protein [Phycisphaerales bacterium]